MSHRAPLVMMLALYPVISAARATPLFPNSDGEVVSFTDRVVRLNGLNSNPGCLQYSADRSRRDVVYVKALELHDKTCGGDPHIEPLLFTLRYDLRTGIVATDKGSITGRFHAIRTPAR